jgi:hypothetical protein
MSSSFPDRSMRRRTLEVAASLTVGTMLTLARMPASAAEFYIQPIASIQAENDSNLDLQPGGGTPEVQGYLADAAALITIATLDSSTTLRPRVIYGEYPKDPGDDHLEGYLDINSTYKTQLSVASLTGSIEHEDLFNAEITPAFYNDVTAAPAPVDTGKTLDGATRDSVLLYPRYVYSFTPVVGAGVAGEYQAARYNPPEVTSFVNFNYYEGEAFLKWTYSQLSTLTVGGYGSYYDATRFTSHATGSGAKADFETHWSPLFTTDISAAVQHTTLLDTLPIPLNTEVNTWGAEFSAQYKLQTSQFRFDVARTISPWGGGSLYILDRLQLQYSRSFNTRLTLTGALIALKTDGLTANISEDDRKYGQAAIDVKWMMTRTFFVQGGYQYAFQKYEYFTDSADNNRVYIRFGYQGLPLQR